MYNTFEIKEKQNICLVSYSIGFLSKRKNRFASFSHFVRSRKMGNFSSICFAKKCEIPRNRKCKKFAKKCENFAYNNAKISRKK